MKTSDAVENKDDPDAGFEREIVLELFRIGVRDQIGNAPDRAAALGAVFREAFSRINWQTKTVTSCGHDVGELGIGVTRIGVLCIKFGWFLAHCGFKLAEPEKYFQPSDH